jgi:hypothetical protein
VQLARVTAAAAIGVADKSRLVDYFEIQAAEIRLGRHAHVPITLDGELIRLAGPLKVEIEAGGLKVMKPTAARA